MVSSVCISIHVNKFELLHMGTALHHAAASGQTRCIDVLISNRAEVDAQDAQHQSALFHAVRHGHIESVNALIHAGAVVNHRDAEQRTPIHYVALCGNLPLLSLLLANGADIQAQDVFQRQPIHYAAFNAHNDVAKYLIECNRLVLDARDADKLTPLHWAAAHGHVSTCELLLRQRCLINPTDGVSELLTPLEYARLEGFEECVAVLKAYGGMTVVEVRREAARKIQRVWRQRQRAASGSPPPRRGKRDTSISPRMSMGKVVELAAATTVTGSDATGTQPNNPNLSMTEEELAYLAVYKARAAKENSEEVAQVVAPTSLDYTTISANTTADSGVRGYLMEQAALRQLSNARPSPKAGRG